MIVLIFYKKMTGLVGSCF